MNTSQIVIILVVTVAASLLKSVTGLGYPMILVPALALFIDVADAVVVVAPSTLVLNIRLTWAEREHRSEARTLTPFLLAGAVGAIVGTALLPVLPERILGFAIVGIVALFVANYLGAGPPIPSGPSSDRLAPVIGVFAGILGGATGIAGPLVSPWFLSRRLDPGPFILAVTGTFALTGTTQLILIVIQGLFTSSLLLVSLLMVPIALVVFPIGVALRRRLPVKDFEKLVIAVLATSAVLLLVRLLLGS